MSTYPAEFNTVIETLDDLRQHIPGSEEELACHWGNAQACTDDNTIRAGFAVIGVLAFADRTLPGGGEDVETAIIDILGDLRHLCDALDLNFDDLSARGEMHYDCELRGVF